MVTFYDNFLFGLEKNYCIVYTLKTKFERKIEVITESSQFVVNVYNYIYIYIIT